MNLTTYFLLSLSIGFPFIAGLMKINTLHLVNQVFIGYLGLGLLIEILFYTLPSNTLKLTLYNFYFLLEFILLLVLSVYWRNARMRPKVIVILLGGIACWLLSILFISSLYDRNPVFQLYVSFFLCISYLDLIYSLSLDKNLELVGDYRFLIAACLIVFHVFNFFVESFFVLKVNLSVSFLLNMFNVKAMLNCLINLLLIKAILCMPAKKIST